MGTGDWNDGMNRVGEKGEGESVRLGWFLRFGRSQAFTPLALARDETKRAETWTAHADALKAAIEREAWDGEWYRRGYFDDGALLGSAADDECRVQLYRAILGCLVSAPGRRIAPPVRWPRSISN